MTFTFLELAILNSASSRLCSAINKLEAIKIASVGMSANDYEELLLDDIDESFKTIAGILNAEEGIDNTDFHGADD